MAVLSFFSKHGNKFVSNMFYFSSQEVFTRIKSDKLIVKHAVMVLLSPRKIVLVQVPLAAAHAHMVRKMYLLKLLARTVFTRVSKVFHILSGSA